MVVNVNISDIDNASDIAAAVMNFSFPNGTPLYNNIPLTASTSITNGYNYSFTYTFSSSDPSGTWTINITANNSNGLVYRTVGITLNTLQVHTLNLKLTINSTANTVYIPDTGEKSFSQLSTQTFTPATYYIASYGGGTVQALVYSQKVPVSLKTQRTDSSHTLTLNQQLSGSQALILFTKGDYNTVESKIGSISTLLSRSSPAFGQPAPAEKTGITVLLNYSAIDIQGNLILHRGVNRLVIQSNKSGSQLAVIVTPQ